MSGVLAAARDEWQRLSANAGVMLILVGGVVFYSLFYPTPYLHQLSTDLPLVVVDADRSALSRQLIRMADATEQLHVVAVAADRIEAQRQLRSGDAFAMLHIPRDFQRTVLRGERQTIGAYANAGYFLVYSQAAEGLSQTIGTLNAGVVMQKLELQGTPASALVALRDPLPLIARPMFNPGGGYATYVVPAVLVLILQQTLLIGLGLLGPASSGQDAAGAIASVCGRALIYVALHVTFLVFFLGAVYGLYGYPQHGAPWLLIVFMLPFQLAVTFLGMLLAASVPSREFALQALLSASMPVLFLSGISWPREAIPAPLQWLAQLIPSTPAIDGFIRINQMGASLEQVQGDWSLLWLQAVVYGAAACAIATRPQPTPTAAASLT